MNKLLVYIALGLSAICSIKADPVERGYALQRLARANTADAVSELTQALDDREPNVAYAAAQALATIGSAKAADALLGALKAGKVAAAGDAALMCAEARSAAGDLPQARALCEACYAAENPGVRWAAFAWLAGRFPDEYSAAVKAQLSSADTLSSAAAVRAVEAAPALVPAALEAAKGVEGVFKARIIAALAQYSAQPDVKAAMKAALKNGDELVRIAALRAVTLSGDNAYIDDLFTACASEGKEERAVAVTLAASFCAPAMNDSLYEKLTVAESRALAIELLAARHEKRLIRRLCDAALYEDLNTAKIAATAFRTALQAAEFGEALNFVCTKLPAERRDVFISALTAVAQQLPDQELIAGAAGPLFAKLDPDGRKSLLPLYSAIQSPEVCGKLAAELNHPDLDYRKEIVRSLAKWSRVEALEALVTCAAENSDEGVKVLALRSALTLMNKEGIADTNRKVAILKTLAGKAGRDAEKSLIFQEVKRIPTPEAQALRRELSEKFGIDDSETTVIAINVGGPAVGHFIADSFFDGGIVFVKAMPIDLAESAGTVPEAVYQSSRYQSCVYRLAGFEAEGKYTLRLHYAELFHAKAGGRAGSVVVNGVKIIDNQPSRDQGSAFTVEHAVTADAQGRIVIEFVTTRDQIKVNGIEIIASGDAAKKDLKITGVQPAAVAVAPVPKPVAGRINVLLLTGANNHNWQETTVALKEVFAEDARFAVAVVENPWDMRPADIEGFNLLFCNWNTFGKDKREWSAEMKAGFMEWVKNGGGFFVLHAGGSIFYDWPEFQTLTGGSWEKETFHPHMQSFTVKIADREHPVTRGLADFEIFDEPWQRVANRNSDRHVLLTSVISKENKGSGAVEPFAWTTQLGKGRCFTLMLGHDGRAIRNAGCRSLVLRGSEWAATGAVK